MSRCLEIKSEDGVMDALVHTPENANRPLPPIIMFTDIGGLRPCYHDKAQKLADAGYAVLLPNIYYRDGAGQIVPEGQSFRDDDIRPTLATYAQRLTPAAQTRDFAALLNTVDAEEAFGNGPIAVVGYCMTGAFALRMAATHPARVTAAAAFHAANLAPADNANELLSMVGNITGRVYMGHADGDALMPPEQIGRLDQALSAAGVDFITELYKGAAHGFTATDAPAYDETADTRHRQRLLTLLEETIA